VITRISIALTFALASTVAFAQGARGLDYRSYLSIQRGMTEGEVLAIAGPPDRQSDQGVTLPSPGGRPRTALAVKTYTYLPTAPDPYATTLTFVGGQLSVVERGGKLAPAGGARGLDFRSYLSLQRGMMEGEVLAIAGPPDLQAEQGAVLSGHGRERAALMVRTYAYLPTDADPHTTTITFEGGRVSEIRRDRKF